MPGASVRIGGGHPIVEQPTIMDPPTIVPIGTEDEVVPERPAGPATIDTVPTPSDPEPEPEHEVKPRSKGKKGQ